MDALAETRDRLAREDATFRRLALKHREYDERLAELRGRRFLTDEEKLEEVRLKKLKLSLKDQMETIVRQHRAQAEGE